MLSDGGSSEEFVLPRLCLLPLYNGDVRSSSQVNLRAIAEYFGQEVALETIQRHSRTLPVQAFSGVFTTSLGIAVATARLGYQATFYTLSLEPDLNTYNLDYYKLNAPSLDLVTETLKILLEECSRFGVAVHLRTLSLDEIVEQTSDEQIPIVLVNWFEISGNKSSTYQSRYVSVVGADKTHIYLYSCGPFDPNPIYPVRREIFDKARKAIGTDQDIIFIRKD